MNTRTFPRTMNQAFPRTVEYGAAIEVPDPLFAKSRMASGVVGFSLMLAVLVSVIVSLIN